MNIANREFMKQVLLIAQSSLPEHQYLAFRKLVMNAFHSYEKGKDQGGKMPHCDKEGGAHE